MLRSLTSPLRRPFERFGLHCRTYLLSKIANDIFLEAELMMLAFATGIMDVVTFPDYHVFASNQTGNTALLAVGTLHIGGGIISLRHIGVSLGFFAAGGFVSGQLGNVFGCKRRSWLFATNLVQTALVFGAAVLHAHTDKSPNEATDLVIIGLLAFASGAQVAMARTVHVPEVTTAMVTSAYIDFLVDPKILEWNNRPRNRRLVFVCCMLLGSFVGAIAYIYVNPSTAIYLSALGKLLVCIALLFNRGEKSLLVDCGTEILPCPVVMLHR
ncbi:hypothetical protein MMC26_002709 [Xylographa opegraphella]|nr:hypothetical protein [Xylographa opegraphella]